MHYQMHQIQEEENQIQQEDHKYSSENLSPERVNLAEIGMIPYLNVNS